jgi:hypothetical protein
MSLKRFLVLLLCIVAPAALAQPLSVVNVQAPNVNFVFNPSGVIPVQDLSSPIWKSGFLQSRNFQGAAGAPAATLHVYEYRIDLRNVVGITAIPFITSLTVDIGPNTKVDFNGDKKLDDVFVITKGGMGTIGLASAVRTGNNVKFTFTSPVGGGSSPGKGQSTFFFGIVSKYKRKTVTATAPNNLGPPLMLEAWAPAHP